MNKERLQELVPNVIIGVSVCVIIASSVAIGLVWMRNNDEAQWRQLKEEGQQAFAKEDFGTAQEKFTQAARFAAKNFGQDDARSMDVLKRLAWVHNASGNYKAGRECLKVVYKLSPEELFRVRTAQTALAWVNPNAKVILADGNPEQSLVMSSGTLEKYLGSSDPELVPLLVALSKVRIAQKRYSDAESELMRVALVYQESEGEVSVGVARTQKLLGDLYREWNKPDEAATSYQKAIATYKSLRGPDSVEIKEIEEALTKEHPGQAAEVPDRDLTLPSLNPPE